MARGLPKPFIDDTYFDARVRQRIRPALL